MISAAIAQIQHITQFYKLHVGIFHDQSTDQYTVTCLDNLNVTVAAGTDPVLEQAIYVACRRAIRSLAE